MKIKNRINYNFIGLFIAIMSIIGCVLAIFFHIVIRNQEINNLQNEIVAKKQHINTYFSNNMERLQLISSRTQLRKLLSEYEETGNQDIIPDIVKIIQDAKQPIEDIERVCIIDLSGKVIASTNNSFMNKDVSSENFFTDIKQKGSGLFFIKEKEEYKILHGEIAQQNDKPTAIVMIVVKIDLLEDIIQQRSGMGDTGEFLVAFKNEKGERIYPVQRRFESEAVSSEEYKSNTAEPMIEALNGDEKTFINTLDYRNKSILATSAFIDNAKLGLVAKKDRVEVFKYYNYGILALIFMFSLSLLVYVLISNSVAKKITKPILLLKENAQKFIKGDLDVDFTISSKDEIGDLSSSFNQAVVVIKNSQSVIDQKVKEQTQEIIKNQDDLENQRKAILNILEDVEDEKNLTEQEKDKIETILQSIGDAVFVVDADLRILLVNPVTIDISGFSAAELMGKKYSDVLKFVYEKENPNEKEEKVNDKFIKNAITTGQVQEMSNHTILITKNGKRIPVADSAAPLKDNQGNIIGCVVVFRDVSREYAIDKAKTEFVSLASHQLRTPLSAINWYAEMLINGDVGKLTKDQENYLQEIYKGNQRMVNLVNALLDVSRIELGTFAVEPEEIDLAEKAAEIVDEMKHQAQEKKIELREEYDSSLPKIMADVKLYQIVIQNLVSNAVKYTPENGKVSLTISKKDPNVLIEVKDTGYGIPKSQQGHMFEKLFRADNVREKDTEGTGLGLYIVKAIVEQSGGKIWFDSEENKGTSFYVEIPLKGMQKKEGTKALEDIK